MAMLKFKKGLYSNLMKSENAASVQSVGTIYVTTDEKAMYVDILNKENQPERIRLSDIVQVQTVSDLASFAPDYSPTALYYVINDNALLKYTGDGANHTWKQINGTKELQEAITANANAISALDERLTALDKTDGRIAAIEGRVTAIDAATTGRMAVAEADIATLKATVGTNADGKTLGDRVTAVEGRMDDAEEAIEALESKDGELAEAIEAVQTNLNTHASEAVNTYATKTELNTAKSAILGQTEGVDFVGTVKEAYAKVEAEAARADAAEKANAAAASAAAEAAATADGKAVQAGKDAAKAQKAADDAQAAAELRVLTSTFEAFKTTNSAEIKAADDKAVSAGNAASAIQEEFDVYELAHANDYNNSKIDELVADAKKAGTDANDNANTRLLKSEFETFKSGNTTAIEAAHNAADAAQEDADEALRRLDALEGDNGVSKAIADAVKEVKEYADQAELDAVATAKGYTDTEVAKANEAAAEAKSAADAAQSDATDALEAIDVINGNGTGSISKAVADAEGRAAVDATQKANTAEANAKAYADAEFVKTNKAVSAAQSKADANEEAIGIINGTGEGSITKAVADAKADLESQIAADINAANAMIYKGEVATQDALDDIVEASVGDTYVVSTEFGSKRPGDLLIAKSTYTETATGEIDGKIPAGYLAWDHVKTGYDADLEQTIETVDGKIQLTSAVGAANNGQISFVSDGSATTVSVASNTVTIGMAWEDFE